MKRDPRTRQIVKNIQDEREAMHQRALDSARKYSNALTDVQKDVKETAAILNANAYRVEFEENSAFGRFTIWGRPSIHHRLIDAFLDILQEQGFWSDPEVYHPVSSVYGTPGMIVEHEVVIRLRYTPANPG